MRKGKGWSLLELLTVIAIIAILVAILFPVFARAKEAARKATCLSNISQISKAMRLYSLDYNDYIFFDKGRAGNYPLNQGDYGNGYYFKKSMKNYIPNWEIWFSPSDPYAKRDFTCSTSTFGMYNFSVVTGTTYSATTPDTRPTGFVGYQGFGGATNATDVGICALTKDLIRLYGRWDPQMDHNEISYRYYSEHNNLPPTPIDAVERRIWDGKGAYGYWDINPSSAELFHDDMPYHTGQGGGFITPGGNYGTRTYGKCYGFHDGHAAFFTVEVHGLNNYGELNEVT